MRNTPGAKKTPGVFGKIFRGIERDENIREQSLHSRLTRFADDCPRQRVSRGQNLLPQGTETRRSRSDRYLEPTHLRGAGARQDLGQKGRRRLFVVLESLSRCRIERRQSVDRD